MIEGKIRGLGSLYSNGLEILEIHFKKDLSDKLPNRDSNRIKINLIVGNQSYEAGIRSTHKNRYIWICPDLKYDNDAGISLSKVLMDNGICKNQTITIEVKGDRFQII